ncbi:hypothetical protein [Rhodococcus sp. IEGM 1305]|uniref:hypothetical protein n=1 Tax=Rhodococcus sp. IEGM 1305 TaxID=3047092 RepID=UPI0024B6B677|nr:hypothetical protein [Rhodococcus sp. IEGM 1305]MDI9947578.1 hypothetical protein [Rhodococcus sp. IEGM 1305]
MKILDGHASTTGSARGIAERITAGLDSAGHDVSLQSCADIAEVNDHDVVPGSAIHNGQCDARDWPDIDRWAGAIRAEAPRGERR